MLVLQRKPGEAVVMNQIITVRVLAVMGDRVKLGFEAPPDIIIVREELANEEHIAPQFANTTAGKPDA